MLYSSYQFPKIRFRRTRASAALRNLATETRFSPEQLILPVFLTEKGQSEDIASLPGIQRWSLNDLPSLLTQVLELGIQSIALFPQVPAERKTQGCEEAYRDDNLINRALKVIQREAPQLATICDVALDPYNPHGHDGFVDADGRILNDETVEALVKQALCLSNAGATILGPSDMMDGRIGAIRDALDANGKPDQVILSYAAKYASAFYGPFRDAIGSAGNLKSDKAGYQMNPANSDEALREVAADIHEGADMVMVKPGLPYLDIIHRVKEGFGVPTFAYHVSGEYASLKAAALNGWLDYDKCIWEVMTSFRRAGADGVLTYAAMDVARLWHQQNGTRR